MEEMNGAMLWGGFGLHIKKEMMSEKESLLEKESRDDGKRVQQCSGSMDTLDRKRKDMLYFKKNWGGI